MNNHGEPIVEDISDGCCPYCWHGPYHEELKYDEFRDIMYCPRCFNIFIHEDPAQEFMDLLEDEGVL